MKLAINQPYLFPYISYFQLINAVDKFIVFDDVQYIKGGWINRNHILLNGKSHLFTFSIKRDSKKRLINQVFFSEENEKDKKIFLKKLYFVYKRAPFYNETIDLVKEILTSQETNISIFITESLKKICRYLNITTPFYLSSNSEQNRSLKGEHRILDINIRMGSTHYINAIGGIKLYSKKKFSSQGIKLNFLKRGDINYPQFNNDFVPDLSIIDVLMFNSNEKVRRFLSAYELV